MKDIKLPSNKSFGVVFAVFFLLISFWPLLTGSEIRIWSLIIAAIFLILASINSKILTPLNILWFKFGLILGRIISPVVLGIVFFLVVTPTGIIMRLIGKDLLNLKKNNSKTYWVEKQNEDTSMKNQF